MKTFIVLSAVLAITFAQANPNAANGPDVEAVVTNPATLQAFTQCLLDTGACDESGTAVKKTLPEAIQTACAKCTPDQKHMMKRYLEEMQKNPADLKALTQKYDPENKYVEALRAALANA